MFKTLSTAAVLFCLPMVATASGPDEQPVMVKSQSGVPIEAHSDPDLCSPDGIGVGGYDLVSYRSDGGPVYGVPDFSAENGGVQYLFVNQENLDAFLEKPQRYLPAYSGFCAITLALGRVTCPEYTNFKIEDEQLLLFEVTGFTNGRSLWDSDSATFRRQADDNFSRLINQQ